MRGEGELLCLEAASRGLPNGFDVEEKIFSQWRYASERTARCAARSDMLSEEGHEDAIRWEMAAAKWADASIKAAKIVSHTVEIRERVAAADRADRAQADLDDTH